MCVGSQWKPRSSTDHSVECTNKGKRSWLDFADNLNLCMSHMLKVTFRFDVADTFIALGKVIVNHPLLLELDIRIFFWVSCFSVGCKNYWYLGIYPINLIWIAFSRNFNWVTTPNWVIRCNKTHRSFTFIPFMYVSRFLTLPGNWVTWHRSQTVVWIIVVSVKLIRRSIRGPLVQN